MAAIIGSIIRQILTIAGMGGVVEGDDIQQAAGAISILISIVWSIMEKRNRTK